MRSSIVFLLVPLVILSCARRDLEWAEVERPLIRLESSLRHEPIFAVRSKIADLDAAVNWYVKHRPKSSETPQVQAIKRAIQHLEYALETPQEEQVTVPAWSKYGIDSLGAQYISRKCLLDTGLLYVNGEDIPIAHMKRALELLAEAHGTPTGQWPQPYDSTKEAEDCLAVHEQAVTQQNAEEARLAAEAAELKRRENAEAARLAAEAAEQKRREAAAWSAAHPLRIEFKARGEKISGVLRKECLISVETEDRTRSGYVQVGETLVAEAKETASIFVWDPDCWDISVNGSPTKLNFRKTQPGSAYQYETVVSLEDFAR